MGNWLGDFVVRIGIILTLIAKHLEGGKGI